jgi:hypothetical protein
MVRNSIEGTLDSCRKKLFYAFGLCENDFVFSP